MSVALPPTDEPAKELEDLLESSFSERERRLPRRELVFEALLTLAFVGLCVAVITGAGTDVDVDLPVVAVVAAYAFASRVAYPLGAGNVVPTQPFLVAMFALASPMVVPLLVCAGLACGTMLHAARGGTRADRVVFAGGDAVHALGPALVLLLAGADRVTDAAPAVLAAALLAQVGFDLGSSTIREWVASQIRPHLQAQVIGQVFAVDLALAPLGFLAALSLEHSVFSALALLPLVALLSYTARDRLRGVERAHDRLVALHGERERLRLAVRRVGEALGSNLDRSAQLRILAQATVEALNAGAARAVPVGSPQTGAVVREGDDWGEGAAAALSGVEQDLRRGLLLARGATDGWQAIGCRVEHDGRLAATLAIARREGAFGDDDAALLGYLCEQAGVSAANVLRHESLHQQAVVDEMTGLANHRRFQELLAEAVEGTAASRAPVALVMFDLDNFKRVNDAHGHQFGDQVLRHVAGHLAREAPAGAEPARYGGEELALVLPGADAPAARVVAERVRRAIAGAPLQAADGRTVRLSVSAGVAALGGALTSKELLVRAADEALYTAKRRGKDRVVVSAGTAALDGDRENGARRSLIRALERDELRLAYQPITELSTGRTVAVEALVRWQHPHEGLITPAEFLPAAEADGLMPALGRWVLRTACREMAALTAEAPGLMLNVNVAPSQLAEPTFSEEVADVLRETGLSAPSLMLELTEVTDLHDVKEAGHQLGALRRLGVRIAIDDFGTGHAGLDHLLDLPVDAVKIPQPYVARLDGPVPRDRILCESLLELVRRTGLGIVAEGIERPEQRRILAGLGVELGQGHLFARPMPLDDLRRLLRDELVTGEDEISRRRQARGEVPGGFVADVRSAPSVGA